MFVIAGVTGRSVLSLRYYIFRLMFSVVSSGFFDLNKTNLPLFLPSCKEK